MGSYLGREAAPDPRALRRSEQPGAHVGLQGMREAVIGALGSTFSG